MARRGRPRKAGKRAGSGQLSRAGQIKGETLAGQPSAWVKEQRDKFGVHYCWALGRAYAAGLLGEGTEALNRYQAAKKFVSLYQRFIGGSAYTCPLDNSPRGGNVVVLDVTDHQQRDHKWLFTAMDAMDVSGCRPYFDQLISSMHIDRGPYWLDAMLGGGKQPADFAVLKAAIQAMDIIAPEAKPMGILVERWA